VPGLMPWSTNVIVLLAACAAALVPITTQPEAPVADAFPGWPSHHDGRPLTELPVAGREAAFASGFPGRIGRFSDGSREIILRWVAMPTRRLHPAADCFKGVGYRVTPIAARRTSDGLVSSCFRAAKGGDLLDVCEHIRDSRGASWPDASSWYWHALLGRSSAPWWSLVVAEAANPSRAVDAIEAQALQ